MQFGLRRRAVRVQDDGLVEVRKPVDSDDLAPPAPLQLEIAPSLASLLGDEVETRSRVAGLAQGMREEYGVPIPVPQVRVSSALGEGEYRLTAHGARIASGRMRGDAHFLPARAGTEAAPKLPGFFPALNGEWTDTARSEEHTPLHPEDPRVGKECVSTCTSGGPPAHYK